MFALMSLLFQKAKMDGKRKVIPCDLGDLVARSLVSGSLTSQFQSSLGFHAAQHTIPATIRTSDLQRILGGIYHPLDCSGVKRLKWDIFKSPSESFDVCRKTLTTPDLGLLQVSVSSCGLLVGNEAVFSIQLF